MSPLVVRTHCSEHRHKSAQLWSTCSVMQSENYIIDEGKQEELFGWNPNRFAKFSFCIGGNKERMVCAVMGNVKADCLSVSVSRYASVFWCDGVTPVSAAQCSVATHLGSPQSALNTRTGNIEHSTVVYRLSDTLLPLCWVGDVSSDRG